MFCQIILCTSLHDARGIDCSQRVPSHSTELFKPLSLVEVLNTSEKQEQVIHWTVFVTPKVTSAHSVLQRLGTQFFYREKLQ